MSLDRRRQQTQVAGSALFDAVVIGGGINGASIYHELARAGFRVLLIDKGDFAGATSQASAMMIWGGLLHFRHLQLATVRRLCRSRDYLIRHLGEQVQPQTYRYLPRRDAGRNLWLARAALMSYWLFGIRRQRPHLRRDFSEQAFLDRSKFKACIEYEEGVVDVSDARFVLNWILAYQTDEQLALNYCALNGGSFDAAAHVWRLEVTDQILQQQMIVSARFVINAAGTWTDDLNQRFQISTPYKHAFGKGVFISYRRDEQHTLPLMIETRDYQGCMSLTPWGPVSMWGPTETRVMNLEEGFRPEAADVRYLLTEINSHLAAPLAPADIISIRCGVRPLVFRRSLSDDTNTFKLSRRYIVHADKHRPWLSIYGGKLTSCVQLARAVRLHLSKRIRERRSSRGNPAANSAPNLMFGPTERELRARDSVAPLTREVELSAFPGLSEPVPSARWCAAYEMCWSLEDYLRRRTNISQWIPRGGLGRRDENLAHLHTLAAAFHPHAEQARSAVNDYQQKINREFDQLLAQCL